MSSGIACGHVHMATAVTIAMTTSHSMTAVLRPVGHGGLGWRLTSLMLGIHFMVNKQGIH